MGKIRIKTIGDEDQEKALAKKAQVKREQKKARETAVEEVAEEKEEMQSPQSNEQIQAEPEASSQKPTAAKVKKAKFKKAKARSTKYSAAIMEIDKNKTYPLPQAIELLRKVKLAKFDETVELHVNTIEPGISGSVKLPHGTGKKVRVAVADDAVLAEVEKGKINFDVLIATPAMMPKLAKVAKFLGPRGLMPNPKNGTIAQDPEAAAKNFQGGQIRFKTEANIPVIHLSVGKSSYEDAKLSENIKTAIQAIKKDRIRNVTLKSTMSPGIKLSV